MNPTEPQATARVVAVQDDLVKIETLPGTDGELAELIKNEVVYICPAELNALGEQELLKAEVLRIEGST
ncbi:MAG: V-type ATP synthase subunit A, partial [Gammaproteobacteria bacterium]